MPPKTKAADRVAVLRFIGHFRGEAAWRRSGLDPAVYPICLAGRPVSKTWLRGIFGFVAAGRAIDALIAEGLVRKVDGHSSVSGLELTEAGVAEVERTEAGNDAA